MASKKKGKRSKRAKRGSSPRLLLRSVIDDLEHGQCGSATVNLVAAAKKTPSRGKLKHHLVEVTRAFTHQCVRGGGGFDVPASMRSARGKGSRSSSHTIPGVTPEMQEHFQRMHREGRLDQPLPSRHVPSGSGHSIPPLRFGPTHAPSYPAAASPSYAPGTSTIPSLRGLGRYGRYRRGR